MPYIQFDVDAKKRVPLVARAAGLPVAEVGWNLLELWEHVWMAGSDVVTELVLTGCVGPSEPLREALVAFGFLERVDGGWRVRGTDRYTRADEARSRGGRAAVGNLRRGTVSPADPRLTPGCPPAEPRLQPGTSPGSTPAKPRTENREPKLTKPPTPFAETPHSRPLVERVVEVFKAERGADYSPTFADEHAGRALLGKGSEDEVLRRWAIGLRSRYPACNGLPDLLRNWNAYATEAANGPPSGAKPVSLVRPLEAEKCAQEGCERPYGRDSYGVPMCEQHAEESDRHWMGAAR
jgi:hypothetical protein